MNTKQPNNEDLNLALVQISKRAESAEADKLVQTFVDVGSLFTLLKTRDHQIVYGRRGTGKTHALRYVLEESRAKGLFGVYLDLRYAGSSGGIYADPSISLEERATRLLLDVLGSVHESVRSSSISHTSLDLSLVGSLLDALGSAITEVKVVGETTLETEKSKGFMREARGKLKAEIIPQLNLGFEVDDNDSSSSEKKQKLRNVGVMRYRVHFGSVSAALREIVAAMPSKKMLLILDEWSAVPLELQPYLADLIRRAIFPVLGITVKIGAIEQRSSFQAYREKGDYLGIEVGADASADINLDDFMVFDNDSERALAFFKLLVFKHYVAENPSHSFRDEDHFIQTAFTKQAAFDEYVQSAEGVPRDGINILSYAAQKAVESKISIPHVRSAARTWYQRGKEAAVNPNEKATSLLHWIMDEVIAHRKTRAFLLRSSVRHNLIDLLFDARVLHIIKRGVSSNDQPGIRYHAYKLDYGCYVDLLATAKALEGLLPGAEDGSYLADVPSDDYRAIRRAILDLSLFDHKGKG